MVDGMGTSCLERTHNFTNRGRGVIHHALFFVVAHLFQGYINFSIMKLRPGDNRDPAAVGF